MDVNFITASLIGKLFMYKIIHVHIVSEIMFIIANYASLNLMTDV